MLWCEEMKVEWGGRMSKNRGGGKRKVFIWGLMDGVRAPSFSCKEMEAL